MNITTRVATFADVDELNAMIARSVRGLSTGYYAGRQIESAIKYIFGVDTQLIADNTYYLCEAEDVIVGCGGWSKRNTLCGGDQHKQDDDTLLEPECDAARIRAFFVDPDYARKGIGTLIMNVCEAAAIANGFKRFELAATLPGVPFYEARGYTFIERIDTVLPDGELLEIEKMGKVL